MSCFGFPKVLLFSLNFVEFLNIPKDETKCCGDVNFYNNLYK